jgi:hypothetical protein
MPSNFGQSYSENSVRGVYCKENRLRSVYGEARLD